MTDSGKVEVSASHQPTSDQAKHLDKVVPAPTNWLRKLAGAEEDQELRKWQKTYQKVDQIFMINPIKLIIN